MSELLGLVAELGASSRTADAALRNGLTTAWAGGSRSEFDDALDLLAQQAAAGSKASLDLLLWATDSLRLVRGPIRQVVQDEPDVEDVAQRTLLAVTRGIANFRGGARYRTWLHTVARNEALQLVRSRSRQPDTSQQRTGIEDDDFDGGSAFVARMSSIVANREAIDAAIAALPDQYREAVVLRDVHQLEYAEIAQRLGIEVGTVKSRINRGRAAVAERLQSTMRP